MNLHSMKSRKKISHNLFFLLGWSYYLLVPILSAYFGFFDDVSAWNNYVYENANYILALYSALIILFYSFCSLSGVFNWTINLNIKYINGVNFIVIPIYILLLIVYVLKASDFIFTGYKNGMDPSLVGPIATLEMALLFHYLYCKTFSCIRYTKITGILILITSIILLGMGGRIYVISALISIFFYEWNWGNINRRKLFFLMMPMPFIVVAIGMWRVSDLNVDVIGFYIFAESLFTSISAFTILNANNWGWFEYPIDFIISFSNVIPVFFWPDKGIFIDSWSRVNTDIEAPFGALNIVASSISNFGFLGGLCFIGFVGFIMGVMKKISKYPLMRVLYCYLVGLLPFIFFRDPYAVQVKLVLMAFILVFIYQAISKIKFPYFKNILINYE